MTCGPFKIGERHGLKAPNISVFHEFNTIKEAITGGFDAWTYEHIGVFSWTVEFWVHKNKQA